MIASETATQIWVGSGSSALPPGLSSAMSSKMPTKTGTMKATTASSTTTAKTKTSAGYIIAERTWRLQRVHLLELEGDPVERLVEAARLLAGADHRAEEAVEDLGVALHRLLQRAAGLDVVAHAGDRLLDLLVLGLLLERVQRAQHRHARGDQGRELAREDRQLAHVDAAASA